MYYLKISVELSPKRYVSPEPQNMTIFEIRVFADIINVTIPRKDYAGLGWALNPIISVFMRPKRRINRH